METTKESAGPTETRAGKILRQADDSRLHGLGHLHHAPREYLASAADEPADLLQPGYWLPLSQQLRQNDMLWCYPGVANATWFLWLIVRDVGPEGVIVQRIGLVPLEGDALPPGANRQSPRSQDEVAFLHEGADEKWVVYEGKRKLKRRCETENAARAWYAEQLAMRART